MSNIFKKETNIEIAPENWKNFGFVNTEYYNIILLSTKNLTDFNNNIIKRNIRIIETNNLDNNHFSENVRKMIEHCLSNKNEMLIIDKLSRCIDNVTVNNLNFVLNKLNINIPFKILDIIIDAVELLEEKSDFVTNEDIQLIKENHELTNINYNYFDDFYLSINNEINDITKPIFTIGIPTANKSNILEFKKELNELFGSDCYIICYYTTNVEPIFNFYGSKELSDKNYIQEINKIIDNLNKPN